MAKKSRLTRKKIKQLFKHIEEKLLSFKQRKKVTICKMKLDIANEALESNWKELNLNIDQWKHKYIYPFG